MTESANTFHPKMFNNSHFWSGHQWLAAGGATCGIVDGDIIPGCMPDCIWPDIAAFGPNRSYTSNIN